MVSMKTVSTAHKKKAQRVVIFIERYDEITDTCINKREETIKKLEPKVATPLPDYNVKVEADVKIESTLLKQAKGCSFLQPKEYNEYCQVCEKGLINFTSYLAHLRTAAHRRMITKKPAAPLDEFSQDAYCTLCNRTYKKWNYFRKHIKKFHQMELTPLRPKPNPNIDPDPNHENHCASCSWTFRYKDNYRVHLEKIHNIVLPRVRLDMPKITPNPDIEPEMEDPNFYCRSCQVKYRNQCLYRMHLRKIHNMGYTRPMATTPPLSPSDIPDPLVEAVEKLGILRCTTCKSPTYNSVEGFVAHIKKTHNGDLSATQPIVVEIPIKLLPDMSNQPDPDDPNSSCRICQKQYPNRDAYHWHVQVIHSSRL